MMTCRHTSQRHQEGGFSLIEVLVTLVIVALVLLGLINLMLRGLQSNASAQLRTIAIAQAYDMADRMRSNSTGVIAGSYNAVLPPGSGTSCSTAGLGTTAHVEKSSSAMNCTITCTTACSVANVSSKDACDWNKSNESLPFGAGAVCKDATNNWYTIYVSWDDNKTGVASKTFSMRFEP